MNILFCGAIDLTKVSDQFAEVVDGFGAKKMHFLDASINYSTFKDWETNSKNSVNVADIVVYVLMERYGEITWKTEYITARNNGKPFIVLVLEDTHNEFFTFRNAGIKLPKKKAEQSKVFEVLETLLLENVTWVKFTYGNFKQQLKEHLAHLYEHGIQALAKENKKDALIALIKSKEFKTLHLKLEQADNKSYLTDILLDVFENKELRKRILDYFAEYKGLTDEQLIDLISDSEQGVSRKTIKSLPQLVTPDNNLETIIGAMIETIEESDDTGILRRVINTLLELDIEKSIPFLMGMFPADDIGTPRRILRYILKNFDSLSKHKNFKKFEKQLKELVNVAKSYTKDSGKLTELAKEIDKKWKDIGSKK